MAYAAWTASTAFAVGNIRRSTTLQASGLVFQCTVAGTSGATEPSWATDIGSYVTDNTVTWVAISGVYEDLAGFAPSAIIELFEVTLDATLHGSTDVYRFHAGCNANVTGNIVWNGNPYIRIPVMAEGFDYTSTGSLPRPTLTVANLDSSISALLLLVNATTPGNDLIGAQVKRIRTLKKYIDGETAADPHAKFPDEIWFIDRKAAENRDTVQFELASKLDMAGVMLPRRQLVANICQWQYKSTECSYTPVASFTGTYNLRALTATYSQTTTTITVTSTAHGYVVGDIAWFDFTSGTAVDSFFSVVTASANTFTITSGTSATTSGNVAVYLLKVTATAHGLSLNDCVNLDFTSGTAVDGQYKVNVANANNFCLSIKSGTTTSGNVTATQWYTQNNSATTTLANDFCKKTLTACKLRFGDNFELPFGSFPGVGLTQ